MMLVLGGVMLLVYQQRQQILAQVAHRFRGRLEYNSPFELPRIRLRFEGKDAVLRYTGHGKRGWHTHFQIAWPDANLRCELYPQASVPMLRILMGMEDIEIGSPQFDQAYFISGNSRREVSELLSTEVQSVVFQLARLAGGPLGGGNIHVEFQGGVLTVTKPQHLSSYDDLDRFIRLSAELYLAALHTRGTGITFVEPGAGSSVPDLAQSQCQICGEPLAGDLVFCASCKTPHHRECWEYFAGCSTYACGGKKFLVKKKRKKAS
jgi:hypothetical protein